MSEDQQIPTPAEIETCTDFIVNNDYVHNRGSNPGLKVVRIGKYVIKYGGRTDHFEAENLLFLEANCTARVPRCYGYGFLPQSNDPFIIMNFIEGEPFDVVHPTLDPVDQAEVIRLIGEQVSTWRSMPSPGYYGSIGKKPLEDWFFKKQPPPLGRPDDRAHRGPFDNHEEYEESIMLHLDRDEIVDDERNRRAQPALALWRLSLRETMKDVQRATWSHCDLMPRNIMVHKDGVKEDGSGIFTVTVIDWETAGWFPEWWEWADHEMFYYSSEFKWWGEALPKIMPMYTNQMWAWQTFRTRVWPAW